MGTLTIGIAESKIARSPDKLATFGLGSCIGLILYDPVLRIGGMVHIMLPAAPMNTDTFNRFKFADTGIYALIHMLVKAGALKKRLVAKAAGGANMFSNLNSNILNIGQRNIEMFEKVLKENNIILAGKDIGGGSGRSIEFCCESNMLQVRSVSPKSIKYI